MIFQAPPLCVVARPKVGMLIPHVGLAIDDYTVVHNTPEEGPHQSTSDEFSLGWEVKTLWAIPEDQRWIVMQRVRAILSKPRPYHLTDFNCMSLVRWLTRPASPEELNPFAFDFAYPSADRLRQHF